MVTILRSSASRWHLLPVELQEQNLIGWGTSALCPCCDANDHNGGETKIHLQQPLQLPALTPIFICLHVHISYHIYAKIGIVWG